MIINACYHFCASDCLRQIHYRVLIQERTPCTARMPEGGQGLEWERGDKWGMDVLRPGSYAAATRPVGPAACRKVFDVSHPSFCTA